MPDACSMTCKVTAIVMKSSIPSTSWPGSPARSIPRAEAMDPAIHSMEWCSIVQLSVDHKRSATPSSRSCSPRTAAEVELDLGVEAADYADQSIDDNEVVLGFSFGFSRDDAFDGQPVLGTLRDYLGVRDRTGRGGGTGTGPCRAPLTLDDLTVAPIAPSRSNCKLNDGACFFERCRQVLRRRRAVL